MSTNTQERLTAAQKIAQTAKKIRKPKDGAGAPELALSSLGSMLSDPKTRAWLEEAEENGNLDPFLHVLLVFIASMRGDDSPMLAIIELPRHRDLPAGTILHRVHQARDIAEAPPPDLLPQGDDDDGSDELELPDLGLDDELELPEVDDGGIDPDPS